MRTCKAVNIDRHSFYLEVIPHKDSRPSLHIKSIYCADGWFIEGEGWFLPEHRHIDWWEGYCKVDAHYKLVDICAGFYEKVTGLAPWKS